MLKHLSYLMLMACVLLGAPAGAADPAPKAPPMTAEQFEASLNLQRGTIALPGGLAKLNLPEQFRYLNPSDTERVLSDAWGNPRGFATLGMIVPANISLLSEASWGVIISYDADGHVSDSDADSIKYDELLKTMQQDILDGNATRKEQGYPAMSLLGWAEPPRYDKATHKMYWAKKLKTEGSDGTGLNYNIRVLGREGVLVLNAVADMGQIGAIRELMPVVTASTEFTPGNRYADYDSSTDKTAEYGLAALVAGGAAAKLGLFGKLFALLLAFKKVIFFAVAGLGAWLFKRWKNKPAVDLAKR